MFVKTFKLKKGTKTAFWFILALLAVFAAVFVFNQITAPKGIKMPDAEARKAFLQEMGWEASEEPISEREVTIPATWNEVYEQYNDLQLEQGLDLSKYKGKKATIYTYAIYNYEEGRPNIVADLIICEGKLIGGDVMCLELGGFMQGLKKND